MPFGSHPCLSTGSYVHDETHLKDYIHRAGQTLKDGETAPFQEYLNKYIYEPESIWDYIERVGGLKRMTELEIMMELGKEF